MPAGGGAYDVVALDQSITCGGDADGLPAATDGAAMAPNSAHRSRNGRSASPMTFAPSTGIVPSASASFDRAVHELFDAHGAFCAEQPGDGRWGEAGVAGDPGEVALLRFGA